MFCKTCGHQNPAHAVYCEKDGTRLPASPTVSEQLSSTSACTQCGHGGEGSDLYCAQCGERKGIMKTQKESAAREVAATIAEALPGRKNTVSVRSFQLSRLNWKTIGVGLAISVILVFGLSSLFMNQFLDAVAASGDEEATALLTGEGMDEFSSELENELGISVPEIPVLFTIWTFVTLAHAGSFDLNVDVGAGGLLGSEFFNAFLSVDNLFYFLILIPIISLTIAGIVTGFIEKKQNRFLSSVLAISVGYTLIILVSAVIARVSFEYQAAVPFLGELSLFGLLTFPYFKLILITFITAVLSVLIGGMIGQRLNGKSSFLSAQPASIKIVIQSCSTILSGLAVFAIINIVNTIRALNDANEQLEPIFTTMIHALSSTFGSIYLWLISHLTALRFTVSDDSSTASDRFSIFGGVDVENSMFNYEEFFTSVAIVNMTNPSIFTTLSFLLPVALLLFSGYRLAGKGTSSIKQLLIFSITYAVFAMTLAWISSIAFSISIPDEGTAAAEFGVSALSAFFFAGLFAFLFTFIGSKLNRVS